jgi:hypothetical protein
MAQFVTEKVAREDMAAPVCCPGCGAPLHCCGIDAADCGGGDRGDWAARIEFACADCGVRPELFFVCFNNKGTACWNWRRPSEPQKQAAGGSDGHRIGDVTAG